jgi:Tol biopolymer transport system component/predicted Ser/Thr protein kinase
MALSPGDRLGPYEISGAIGAGGMGEVYRARDPRMGRDVAIKVSAERFSERFDREVRAVAALNHPNICSLYDVGPDFLVMELVEGTTLADRIHEGLIPTDEVLKIVHQIAAALEAAHEKGIVHRDLKPANIKIKPDGTVKVLDFGLAKTTDNPHGDPASSPTMTMSPTRAGMILGTAAYMAPEQARGKAVDKRADIWSFGVVLYEMLTGKQLFHGETVSDVLAAVLKEQPDLSRIPARFRPLIEKCLERDPKQRLRDIGDMRLLLDRAEPVKAAAAWWPLALAAALAIALTAVLFIHAREAPPAEPASMRFEIPAPEKTHYTTQMALSPDGRMLAFTAVSTADGSDSIWVRPLDSVQAKPLRQAHTTQPFFWSADSRFIAYNGGGKLTKIDVSGGPPQPLCETPNGVIGGFWTRDGTIVFGNNAGGLMSVAASGGVASVVTPLGISSPITGQVMPSALPDGKHLLYFTRPVTGSGEYAATVLTSLGAKDGGQRLPLETNFAAMFVPVLDGKSGHVLFLRDGTLMAQPFDLANLALAGAQVPLAEGIGTSVGHGFFSASNNGVLAYRTGSNGSTRLAWFDRTGKEIGDVGKPGDYRSVAISPDGAYVASSRVDGRGQDLWLFDLERGTSTRLTSARQSDTAPAWSPDGKRIAFASGLGRTGGVFVRLASGDAPAEKLLPEGTATTPWGWSSDGHLLLYSTIEGRTGKPHLWVVPVAGDGKPARVTQSEFGEVMGQFSPDGHWISYTSNESGIDEIYVRPFPSSPQQGGKIKISEGGGYYARWRRDGKELFYVGRDSKVMAVNVSTSPQFKAGLPQSLFPARIGFGLANSTFQWDVSADGKRFLIDTVGTDQSDPITIVTNWQWLLKK